MLVDKKEVLVKRLVKNQFMKKMKLSGYTNASRVVTIKSQAGGKIASKFFKKGQKVIKQELNFYLLTLSDKIAKLKEREALSSSKGRRNMK